MLEVYQAYGDYRTMMDLTEKLIVDAIEATGPGLSAALGREDDRLHAAVSPGRPTTSCSPSTRASRPTTRQAIAKLAEEIGFETGRQASGRDQERGVRGEGRRRAGRARSS